MCSAGHAGQLEDCSKVTVYAEVAGAGLTYNTQKTADIIDTHSHNSSHSSKRAQPIWMTRTIARMQGPS